tara:strand:+ start:1930 stop:2769 length:840 start_codon:yes stop_codon:yes gene_type:complete
MVNYTDRSKLNSAQALKWLVDMGADEITSDTPINRFVIQPQNNNPKIKDTATRIVQPVDEPVSRPAPVGKNQMAPSEGAHYAASVAAAAKDIKKLRAAVEQFEGCALKFTATTTVFSDGNPNADLMIVGEAPGVEEDKRGRPFVGASGVLLDKILHSIDLDRSKDCYITNVLFWRPPGNRSPTNSEIAACLPFVWRHIELKNPKVIILLGGTASKTILNTQEGIMRLRGKWSNIQLANTKREIPCMPTFHPSFLLRQPNQKREAWRDFRAVKTKLLEYY